MLPSRHRKGPIRVGTIPAADGSVWSYEIGVTGNARLLWVLHAPDKTHRASVAAENATVADIERDLHALVALRSQN